MKAYVYEKYGSYKNLILKELDKPVPKTDEVLVKIHAFSINDWDWALLLGKSLITRMGNGLFKPKMTPILGSDISGVIESVGKDIKNYQPGDSVYGDISGSNWGGFAEFACAKENALILKPKNMSFEDAAALPQAGILAVQGLFDQGNIQKGNKILINGAGGGVGTLGIQIAKQFDCEVTGVDSSDKFQMMTELGYDHLIDYRETDFTKAENQYDLILDNKTLHPIKSFMKVLTPQGTYVTTGGSMGRILEALLLGPLFRKLYKKQVKVVMLNANKDLAYFNDQYNSGLIKPVIDGSYELEQLPEAMKYFDRGGHKGKLVITVIPSK